MRAAIAHVVPLVGCLLLGLAPSWDVGRADEEHLGDLSTPTATCLSCHPFHAGHSFDLDYAQAAYLHRHDLRDAAEVVRRGVFLPGGRVVCFTCHDASSPWKSKIAIPPGSKVSDQVNPRDPRTYDPDRPPARAMTVEQARVLLPAGTALSPKPLCLACHARD